MRNSNPASVGSGDCSRRDEARQRTLLLVVDPCAVAIRARRLARAPPLAGWLTRLQLAAICDQLDCLIDEAARREMPLEALTFLVELEIAREDGRRIGIAVKIAHVRTLRSAIPSSPPPSSTPCSTPTRSLPFAATAPASARNAALSSSQAAVSMPSEGGGKHKIQGGSLWRRHQGGVSFGCRWDPNVGRGWLALVPLRIAQLSILGDRGSRRAVSRGWIASGAITSRRSRDQGPQNQSAAMPRIRSSAGFAEGKEAT